MVRREWTFWEVEVVKSRIPVMEITAAGGGFERGGL